RLFLLQSRRIEQDHAGQLAGRCGGVDGSAKSALDQQGNAPAVIQMGMREQHGIDAGRIEFERIRITGLDLAAALEQAAIDEHAPLVATDQRTGSGDLLGGAVATVDDHGSSAAGADDPARKARMTRRRPSSQTKERTSMPVMPASATAPGTASPMIERRSGMPIVSSRISTFAESMRGNQRLRQA